MVLVVLGVVLEQVEAAAKPLHVPVLKKNDPGTTKTTDRATENNTKRKTKNTV